MLKYRNPQTDVQSTQRPYSNSKESKHTMQDFQILVQQIDQSPAPYRLAEVLVNYYISRGCAGWCLLSTGETVGDAPIPSVLISWLSDAQNRRRLPAIYRPDSDQASGFKLPDEMMAGLAGGLIPLRLAQGQDYGVLWLDCIDDSALLVARLVAQRLHDMNGMNSAGPRMQTPALEGQIAQMILNELDLPGLMERVVLFLRDELQLESVEVLVLEHPEAVVVAASTAQGGSSE